MQRIMMFLANNLVSVVSISILTGATVTTSMVGVSRVTGNFNLPRLAVPDEKTAQANTSSSSSASLVAKIARAKPASKTTSKPTPKPLSSSSSSLSAKSPTIANQSSSSSLLHAGKDTGKKNKKVISRDQDQEEEDMISHE